MTHEQWIKRADALEARPPRIRYVVRRDGSVEGIVPLAAAWMGAFAPVLNRQRARLFRSEADAKAHRLHVGEGWRVVARVAAPSRRVPA